MAASSDTKKSISSYLPADTYNSLKPDGDLTFLHTMLRVSAAKSRIVSSCRMSNDAFVHFAASDSLYLKGFSKCQGAQFWHVS